MVANRDAFQFQWLADGDRLWAGWANMPTICIERGFRFYFYSFDCNEPKHVHVQREKSVCKFWLAPVALAKKLWLLPQRAEFDPTNNQLEPGQNAGGMG